MAGPRKPEPRSEIVRTIDHAPAAMTAPPAAKATRVPRPGSERRLRRKRDQERRVLDETDLLYQNPLDTPQGQKLETLQRSLAKKKERMAGLGAHVPVELMREVGELEDKISEAEVRMGTQQLDEFQYMVRSGAVVAPYVDPRRCTEVVDMSDILTSCIAAMSVNVGGHGYYLEPRLAPAKLQTMLASEDPVAKAEAVKLQSEIDKEKSYIDLFFMFCCTFNSFASLREMTTWDKESTGYAFWEIIDREVPDERGNDIAGFEHMRSWTMRITPLDDATPAKTWRLNEKGDWEEIEQPIRFRRVCQVVQGQFRWFKQLGDPRAINRFNGAVARDDAEAERWAEASTMYPTGQLATRCIMFNIYHPRTPYGAPRWMAATPSAIGRRKSQEVDLLFFDNKAIPPLVVTVSGGELTPDSFAALQDQLDNMKGVEQFDDILLLEALPDAGSAAEPGAPKSNVKIDFKPMVQVTEGRFMEYKAASRTDVRTVWRLPPIVVGLSEDLNFASADASMMMAEQQVWQPDRNKEDFVFNHMFFPMMGIRHWLFRTKPARSADDTVQTAILTGMGANGAISPNEWREFAGPKIGKDFPQWKESWANQPFALTLAAAQAAAKPEGFGGAAAGGLGAVPPTGMSVPKDKDLAAAKAKLHSLLHPELTAGSPAGDDSVHADVETDAAANAAGETKPQNGGDDSSTQEDMGNRRRPRLVRVKMLQSELDALLAGCDMVDGIYEAGKELTTEIAKRYALERARMRTEELTSRKPG